MSSERELDGLQTQRLETAGLWLIRLQEDMLTESEVSEWIEWCESDPENLRAFEQLQSLWQAAGERLPPAPRSLLHTRIPLWTALAASVVLMLCGGLVFLALRQAPGPQERIANQDWVQTPVAQNQPVVLPDGSQLEMGGRSRVTVDFTADVRRLHLRDGEAFFQVKHDADRPFVVDVGDLRVVAVGTAFNVRRAGEQVAITVQEGIVEVRRSDRGTGAAPQWPGPTDLGRPMQVQAGEQLVVDVESGKVRESVMDPAVALAWRSGRLEFTGDSLATVIASVNRYATRPIALADPQLGELTFTGTVFFDSIDAWVDGLQQVFPITVDRSAEDEIVLAARPPSPR